jgi:catechol 2,3-dioxygenase-like lactoylglutathione lyase family enzyme
MLKDIDAKATIAVKDITVAKKFYEDALGLTPDGGSQEHGVQQYKSGHTTLVVYQSEYARTNKATVVTWDAGGKIEEIVGALKAKGVKFEHYDMPGLELQGDLHVADGFKGAWFTDPDGNIFHVVQM